MNFRMLVALEVTDENRYSAYRDAMRPILEGRYGGGFQYDFSVDQVLKTAGSTQVNRVFVIGFQNKDAGEAFFKDPEYLAIKKKYFEGAVGATEILGELI